MVDTNERCLLTKSRYFDYTVCPKKAWLGIHAKKKPSPDEKTQLLFDNAAALRELAQGLFPGGVDAKKTFADGAVDYEKSARLTEEMIDNLDVPAIYNATLVADGFCATVDILARNDDDTWTICDVKSATKIKDPDLVKIAFVRFAAENWGLEISHCCIAHVDGSYRREKEVVLDELFEIEYVTRSTVREYERACREAKKALRSINRKTVPRCGLSDGCHTPYDCDFWNRCSRRLPKPSVFDIYNARWTRKMSLYSEGKWSMEDVDGEKWLSEIQQRQIDHATHDLPDHIDKNHLRGFLKQIGTTPYALDLETVSSAVPLYEGTRPYQQVTTQYSTHYFDKAGHVVHSSFIASPDVDERRELAERICHDIPANKPVLVYYASFENKQLSDLARLFPDLAEHLTAIQNNIVDLHIPFKKGWYYNRAMGGSFSIKDVAPALFPGDEEVSYGVDGGIHDGYEASCMFASMANMDAGERSAVLERLERYCEMDSYALIKLWNKMKEAVAK